MKTNLNPPNKKRNINLPVCEPVEVNDVINSFLEISEKFPKNNAIYDSGKYYTYNKLAEDVGKLSYVLQKNGIKEGDIIAVVIDRNYNYFVSILATLNCAAAFLSVDPSNPNERISFFCSDASVSLILSDSDKTDFIDHIQVLKVPDCLEMERISPLPKIAFNQESVAYIIYTSGSTGVPKGVKISRKALANFISGALGLYQISVNDRILQFSNLSFDASIEEIFGAFCTGATLYLRTDEMLLASELIKFSELHQITIWDLPTAFWRQIIHSDEYQKNSLLQNLRLVIIGGEAVSKNDVATWNKKKSLHRLFNTYGPTETTVVALAYEIKAGYTPEELVPIGRPLPGYHLYITDPERNIVPYGLSGELLVAGESVAIGYLNREIEQNRAFILIDTPDNGIQRCYCTGDMVMADNEGMILFQGRIDRQVKIRGFRVEPGEIESVLSSYEGIFDNVVIAREDQSSSKSLVAYIVNKRDKEIDLADLRHFIKLKLPEYMVPSAFVVLEKFPLTSNGKIDFKLLPEPDKLNGHTTELLVAPSSKIEKILASIWTEILNIKNIGIYDNFFEMGGNSLAAAMLISGINKNFGVRIALRVLFEKQTLMEIAAEVEQLLISDGENEQSQAIPHIDSDSDVFPLSHGQKRLWFIQNFEPGNIAYNVPFDFSIRGEIDPSILEQCISELIKRHSSLRTVIQTSEGVPMQKILPPYPFHLGVVHLENLPEEEQMAEAEKYSNQNEAHLFDLETGPLFICKLLKLSSTAYTLLMNFHHIITDGWSVRIFLQEMGQIYTALKQQQPVNLAPLPVTYADYAIWQNQWIEGEGCRKQLEYWKNELKGAPDVLQLPMDFHRPKNQTYDGDEVSFILDDKLTGALQLFSKQNNASLFVTLLSIFNTLLTRYTTQEEFVIGIPIAGRIHKELESLNGMLINNFPLRITPKENMPFSEMMEMCKTKFFQAYDNQELPMDRLVEELKLTRHLNIPPLFQVMFNLLNMFDEETNLSGATMEMVDRRGHVAQFDLSLHIYETKKTLTCVLEYNTNLFKRERIERMAGHFTELVRCLMKDPGQNIGMIPILTQDERDKLLIQWNDTAVEFPADKCVHQLFEEQVLKSPDAQAIQDDHHVLTYRELNAKANKLARHLRHSGAGEGSLIGICADRSTDLLVALLAVMKAGCTYIPLDPIYPKKRLALILEDSNPVIMLTEKKLLEDLPQTGATNIFIEESQAYMSESDENTNYAVSPSTVAYLIYTSGSTGKPKGVQIQHRALVNFLVSMRKMPGIDSSDVLLAVTTISFDIAGLELFLPILCGARIVITTQETSINPELLIQKIETCMPTLLQATPVTFRMLNSSQWSGSKKLRILCGGEALPKELALELIGKCAGLWNMYGPTETTIWSTVAKVVIDKSDTTGYVNLGRPIDNTLVYVLNSELQPVPAGYPGELFIGGQGLAKGYFNLPEMTSEKFLPDPFSGLTGARMYRTGDLVQQTENGALEFLNRVDSQVKIRGFRIELGEIESVLAQYQTTRDNVVVVREDSPGDKRLIAYIIQKQDQETEISDLRQFLKTRLPDYMVPSGFIFISQFPLTPNGKIDRKALPAPGDSEHDSTKVFIEPQTETEKELAVLWCNSLKINRIGIDDNFFELGGNSLVAAMLISGINKNFGVRLALRVLFEKQTLMEIAAEIEQQKTTLIMEEIQVIPHLDSDSDVFPLSHGQKRLWFIQNFEPGNIVYNVPFDFSIRGEIDPSILEQGISELIKRHSSLRTVIQTSEGVPMQKILPPYPFRLGVVHLENLPEEEQMAEAEKYASQNETHLFDLETGPLFICKLLKLSSSAYTLLMNFHHIITDGRSVNIFVEELGLIYTALKKQQPVNLAPLPVTYADFAIWQNQWIQGEGCRKQLEYWKNELTGAPDVLHLPMDFQRPKNQTYDGDEVNFILDDQLTGALQLFSKQNNTSLFVTLLSIFNTLITRYASQEEFVIGIPIAGRIHRELESLNGMLINNIPMRITPKENMSFPEMLEMCKTKFFQAYDNQELPMDRIMEELELTRHPNISPLFQVMFNFLKMFDDGISLSDATMEMVDRRDHIAKFDLSLHINERKKTLNCILEYNTNLFKRERIERMAGHFTELVRCLMKDPGQNIGMIPILTQDERDKLLIQWNDTKADYPNQKCIHHLFEEQVLKTPDAIAVVYEKEQLTYAELNDRANQVANYLLKQGSREDTYVALFVERGLDMITGLLAISKTGATYLPLDPIYPKVRLGQIVDDAKPVIMLTQKSLIDLAPEITGKIIFIDDRQAYLAESKRNLSLGNYQKPVYILYTSGSTGKPKGVPINHFALVNLVYSMNKLLRVTDQDILLSVTTVSFDIAEAEMYMPLFVGAKVVIASHETASDMELLAEKLEKTGATLLLATPVTFKMLMIHSWKGKKDLRMVCGGEALSKELVRYMLSRSSEMWNVYAPTETTVYSVVKNLTQEDAEGEGYVPLGRPIDNTTLYVLNKKLMPVPVGVPGELYIGGDGLSPGYLNLPELTNERFIPNPFGNSPEEKIYKTGDLVQYFNDGNILFLNRIDSQVKIRGFRIELGEIESALAQYQTIRDNVVLVREDSPGDKRLVAYIIQKQDQETEISDLRQFLKTRVPDYMVPSSFVFISQFPLTQTGKIDRKALPAPGDSEQDSAKVYVEPRTETEKELAGLLSEILKVNKIGIHDNFFELGGNSLVAAFFISGINKNFGVRLALRVLFEKQTLMEIAAEIDQQKISAITEEIQVIPHLDSDSDLFPLSHGQKRLWFIQNFEPGNIAYNVPLDYNIRGEIDPSILEQCISELIKRHPSLRTVIQTSEGVPMQKILPPYPFRLGVVHLENLPEEEKLAEAEKYASQNETHRFDLETGPLFICKLLKLSSTAYTLLMNFHHIITDGWSVRIFVEELGQIYTALKQLQPVNLAPLPVTYADFAIWQNQWIEGEGCQKQLEYWKNELTGAPDVLQLPMDFQRPKNQTYDGDEVSFILDDQLTGALQLFSKQKNTSLFVTLLSIFNTLITRYTTQEEFVIGIPIAGRIHRELESLNGMLINNFPLRITPKENMPFSEMMEMCKTKFFQAYDNQELPTDRIVEELKLTRHPNISPLFQVMFNLLNMFDEEINLSGATMEMVYRSGHAAQFDLSLHIYETKKTLNCVLEYNTNLFKRERIERMAGHFTELVRCLMKDPGQNIGMIPILTQDEKDRLLIQWNDTAAEFPADKCIHHLFEEQVLKTPDAVAVVYEKEQLTYAELNDRANQLANYLMKQGSREDTYVALFVERGLDMITGLLAISKTGATYLPLDPIYPKARLALIIGDAKPVIVLTQKTLENQLPDTDSKIIFIDDKSAYLNEPASNLSFGNPIKPAYILYTSGSTGKPKGVPISQQAVINLVNSMGRLLAVNSKDILLAVTTISFDIAELEMYMPLFNGAKLVIGTQEMASDMELLAEKIEEHSATIFQATPVTFKMLMINSWKGKPDLKLICGGEALSSELVRQLLPRCREIWNGYGPTETAIYSVVKKLTDQDAAGEGYVPIGRPIDNTTLYVLNNKLMPVPVGVPGELFIGGQGVSPGYLNLPDLTNERFIPNPFGKSPDEKIYKTGDLVQYFNDGNLIFLNRADSQVKIRGFRIELGEIESALAQYQTTRDNVVLVREDSPGDKRLVAYIIQKQDQETEISDLRQFLKTRLPDYMVPSGFVFISQFPLTQSGKIDRKALPAPGDSEQDSAKVYVEPRTETEKKLAGLLSEILKVNKIGIHDNFFELGGNSLVAAFFISSINKNFGVRLALRVLFEKQTLMEIAAEIDQQKISAITEEIQVIPHLDSDSDVFPLSHGQKRLWFIQNFEPGNIVYNVPFEFSIRGEIDPSILEQCISELIKRHSSLRTVIQTSEGVPMQKILPPYPFRLGVVHLENLPEEEKLAEAEKYANQNDTHLFDLETGPLFICKLLKLSSTAYTLLMNFHHIITDGWSVNIFVEELGQIYTALKQQQPANLAPLPVTYADFAIWQNQWIQGEGCRKQLEYWKNELTGAPDVLQLPMDFQRPKNQTYDGDEVSFILDDQLTGALQLFSKQNNASLFVTLLSIFNTLVTRYTTQEEFVIGIPIAGRIHRELESLNGMLINNFPLRITPKENMSFPEMMEMCKTKFFQAYDNQELPMDRMVEELKLTRHLNIPPLFQVMFNLLHMFDEETNLSGATMEMVDRRGHVAKFDLSLHIYETKKTLNCVLEYNTNLFKRERIERMAGHFTELVRCLMKDPGQNIGMIPILTQDERDKLLIQWNDTAAEFPADKCIHHLFEEQVLKTPDAVAVVYEKEQLTYAELNDRANQLANYLMKQGSREDTYVALFVERGLDMITGLLAISKTGATYLPLDPIYPKARLALIIGDAKPVIVLTQKTLENQLPDTDSKIIFIDDKSAYLNEPASNLSFGNPIKPAYILYTSGSTGKPKGVPISQQAVINLVNSMGRLLAVNSKDILLAVTTISFDIAELEMYMPLFNGAKLVIGTQEMASDMELLAEKIEEHSATIFQATPVTFKMLMINSWKGKPDLKLICGGEALSSELVRQLLPRCREIWNGYGPTETAIYSVVKKLTDQDAAGEGYVPIGRPIDNTTLYVLNNKLMPVPVGVPGELFIGGKGVSPGYLNLPDLTNERFIPNPFGKSPDEKIYKTGDLVQYFNDGNLIFLNRADSQVKIRGFRIELGEIESALAQYQTTRDNVVLVREDSPGDKRLVAYIIQKQDQETEISDLRQFLKTRLPDYMVPSGFVFISQFPLTQSGKIDRKALPAPGDSEQDSAKIFIEPQTETEKKLADIWCNTLKIDRIGINENFFEIGGHSMLAVSLMIKIEKALGTRLPLATLFDHSNIRDMAILLDKKAEPGRWNSLVPIRAKGNKRPLYLVHGAGLNLLLYTTIVSHLDEEQPVFGLQAKGLDGKEEPLHSIEEIASHYISEILAYDNSGTYALAGFSMGGYIAFEIAKQLVQMNKKVSFLGAFDTVAFDSPDENSPIIKRYTQSIDEIYRKFAWLTGTFLKKHGNEKIVFISSKWKSLIQKITKDDYTIKPDIVSKGTRSELPKYLHKVHRANHDAMLNYKIPVYPGKLHLFKALQQSFYIKDPVLYSWDKFAKGGIVIHDIPGEHSRIFAPPNDKIFAEALQKCLNEENNQ